MAEPTQTLAELLSAQGAGSGLTEQPITMREFLERQPPSRMVGITDLWRRVRSTGGGWNDRLTAPELQLHCDNDNCKGLRYFRCTDNGLTFYSSSDEAEGHLIYLCWNCQGTHKRFSLHAKRRTTEPSADLNPGECYKYGELPAFGPVTPPRLLRLFENERDNFLKGRRCEGQGLGIGAFAYYRRVVENQKNRILDEVIKACKVLKVPPETIKLLEDAKKQTQFSNAINSIKDAIPQGLLIDGDNPLLLLHAALSGGLHAKTDEECLSFAHDARIVLVELAERLDQTMKDEAELNAAVKRLRKVNQNS
jgi:hypothetical protein